MRWREDPLFRSEIGPTNVLIGLARDLMSENYPASIKGVSRSIVITNRIWCYVIELHYRAWAREASECAGVV